MKKISGFLLFITFLSACHSTKKVSSTMENNAAAGNTLTDKEKREGWQLLFDGQTTSGWHSYGKQTAGTAWTVQNGALCFDPKSNERGDLLTDQEYGDFHLKLDWRIAPKGNSGIIFYVKDDPAKYKATYHTGLEMQVLDNAGHADANIHKHRAGDLYDLIASKEVVKPAGEWNHVEVVSKNGKLDFYMNGEHTLSTTLWDDNWRNMVANSKFKEWSDFGTFKTGKIALQDHGDEVCFRNILIRRL